MRKPGSIPNLWASHMYAICASSIIIICKLSWKAHVLVPCVSVISSKQPKRSNSGSRSLIREMTSHNLWYLTQVTFFCVTLFMHEMVLANSLWDGKFSNPFELSLSKHFWHKIITCSWAHCCLISQWKGLSVREAALHLDSITLLNLTMKWSCC